MTKDGPSIKRTYRIKKQRKPPMTSAARSKAYRERQKAAFDNKTMTRTQVKKFLKEKNRRSAKNKPKTCRSLSTRNFTATLNWMNAAQSIQNDKYKCLRTRMRHSCTPTFVAGQLEPLAAQDTGARQIYFLDDNNRWQHWLNKQKSSIAGFGIFAARPLGVGAVCTRYMGQKTTSVSKAATMFKESAGYVFKFKRKGRDLWVAPDLTKAYMYGHFLNHSEEPNCVVDKVSGVVTTMYVVNAGEELTINYGKEYNWTVNK